MSKWYQEIAPALAKMNDLEAATLAAEIINRVGFDMPQTVNRFLEALGDDELQELAVAILDEP